MLGEPLALQGFFFCQLVSSERKTGRERERLGRGISKGEQLLAGEAVWLKVRCGMDFCQKNQTGSWSSGSCEEEM